MPPTPEDALRSPDGASWWDGTAWHPIVAEKPPIPEDAVRSPDGTWWWDGTVWRLTEAAPWAPPGGIGGAVCDTADPAMTDVAPQIATLPWANGMLTVLPDRSIEVRVAQKKLFGNGHTMKVVSTLRRDQVVRFETRRWPDGSATLTVCVDKGGTRDYQGVTLGPALNQFVSAVGARVVDVAVQPSEGPQGVQERAQPTEVKLVTHNDSESERYFRRKNAAQRKRKIGRAVGTTACCGIPCLMSLTLMLGVLATLLLALTRL